MLQLLPGPAVKTARSSLPGNIIDSIRDGAPRGIRSNAVMSVAVSMVNHGWTWAEFHAELTNDQNGLADWAMRRANGSPRNNHDSYVRLERAWRKAERFVADRPAIQDTTEAVQTVGELRGLADHRQWPGRGGQRDREVYVALLAVATRCATLTPAVAVRTLTEQSSFRGWKTICRAIDSLVEQGLLTKLAPATSGGPTRYQLVSPPVPRRHTSSHAELGGAHVSLRHDASGTGGDTASDLPVLAPLSRERTRLALMFGAHAAAVHAALVEFPMPVSALVNRSGVSRRTVYRWLPKLALLGLARKMPLGWVVGDTDPDRVAFEYGVELVERDRYERHELSRRGYQEALAIWRERGADWREQREAALARGRARRGPASPIGRPRR